MKKLSKTQPIIRFNILTPQDLLEDFQAAVKGNYTTASSVLRKLMSDYVKANKS